MTDFEILIKFCDTFEYDYNIIKKTETILIVAVFGSEFEFHRDKGDLKDDWTFYSYPANLEAV